MVMVRKSRWPPCPYIAPITYNGENFKNLLRNHEAQGLYVVYQCLVVPKINPANQALEAQTSHTPGVGGH